MNYEQERAARMDRPILPAPELAERLDVLVRHGLIAKDAAYDILVKHITTLPQPLQFIQDVANAYAPAGAFEDISYPDLVKSVAAVRDYLTKLREWDIAVTGAGNVDETRMPPALPW